MRRRSSRVEPEQALGCPTVVLIAVAVTAVVAIKAAGGLNIEYSDGSRSGTVTKISRKGMIWQTWEGELDLHRLRSTGGEHPTMTADLFYFSASDPEIVKQIEAAEQSGNRTTLKYKQYILRGWKYGNTSYDIVGVEVSGSPARTSAGIQ